MHGCLLSRPQHVDECRSHRHFDDELIEHRNRNERRSGGGAITNFYRHFNDHAGSRRLHHGLIEHPPRRRDPLQGLVGPGFGLLQTALVVAVLLLKVGSRAGDLLSRLLLLRTLQLRGCLQPLVGVIQIVLGDSHRNRLLFERLIRHQALRMQTLKTLELAARLIERGLSAFG